MPDLDAIIKDPDFSRFNAADRRSILDSALKSDADFGRMKPEDQGAIRRQLYQKYVTGSDRRSDQTETHPNQGRASNTGQSITMSPQARSGRIQSPSDRKRDSGKDTTKGAGGSIGNRVEKKVQPVDGTTTSPLALRDSHGNLARTTIGPQRAAPEPNPLQKLIAGFGDVMGYPQGLVSAAALPLHQGLQTYRGMEAPTAQAGKVRDQERIKSLMQQNILQRAHSLAGQNPLDPLMGRTAAQGIRDPAERKQFGFAGGLMRMGTQMGTDPVSYVFSPAASALPRALRVAVMGAFASQMAASGGQKVADGIKYHDKDLGVEGSLELAMAAFAGKHAHGESMGFKSDAMAKELRNQIRIQQAEGKPVSPAVLERLSQRFKVPVKDITPPSATTGKARLLKAVNDPNPKRILPGPKERKPVTPKVAPATPREVAQRAQEEAAAKRTAAKAAQDKAKADREAAQKARADAEVSRTAARTPAKAPQRPAQPSGAETRPAVPPAQNNATEPIVEAKPKRGSKAKSVISDAEIASVPKIKPEDMRPVETRQEEEARIHSENEKSAKKVQGKAEVKPTGPNTHDEYIDLSHEVEASHDKLSSREKPHAGAANSELNRLEELGIDVSDSRDALEEYKGITRSEYPDAEEYRDARGSAWQDFLDAHQGLDATEVDNPDYDASSVHPVKEKPAKPAAKEPVVTASTPGAVTLSATEANTVAMHLSEDHPLSDRLQTADKPVLISAEQADHLRGILDKSGIKIDKSRLKGLYPDKPSAPAVKGKPAAAKKPDKPINIKARFGASHPTETVRAAEFAQKQGAVFTEDSFLDFSDRLEEAQKGKFGLAKTVAERKVIEEEVAKSKPADTKPPDRPSGGAPPPDAPIVGGAPDAKGGSGRPATISFNALKLPKLGTVKAKVSEWTRQLSNWFNRGSTGIERHARKMDDPTLLRAQRKEAGTRGQINAMLYHTIPLIRDAFKGSDSKMSQFFHYLAEGSLRGARQRWEDAQQQVLALDPAQLADPKIVGKYIDYLEKLEGRRRGEASVDIDRDPDQEMTTEDKIVDPANHDDRTHFAPGLARRARNLLTNGAYDEMRILMAGAFDEAYRTVGVMADFDPSRTGQGAEDFGAYGQKPDVQKAMKYYKEGIADPVTGAYEKNRGVKSDYLGPLETYFPLVPFREGEGTGHSLPAAPRAPFHNVPTAGAKFKTGLAEQYDTSVATIMDRMTYDLKRNNRGALVNTLRDMGLAVDLPQGTDPRKASQTITVNGEPVPAVVKPWKDSTKVVQNGKTYFTGGKNMLVAKFAADEITPQLEHTDYEPGGPLSAITQAAITGPNAALIHNHNLASSLVSGTPFVGTGLGKVPGSIPGLKLATAIHQMMNIDPSSPDRAADIRLLAEMGLFHPKSGTVTTSKAVSELHGTDPETGKPNIPVAPTSAMLYGMRGTELRTRLALMDVARATAAESGKVATQEDIFDFVSQAGIYAHGLDSVAERVLKKAQIAPFITAGKTQIGLGVRALSGTTPLPRGIKPSAKVNLRARQLISSGIVGATALWFATFKAYTGRIPNRDDKFNQIPVRPEHRNSKIGQVIFGPGDNPVSVSLDISNPALARGMHATGARSIINGVRAGDDWNKIISNSHKDILNGLASPVTTSPQLRFGTEAAAGVDPYLTSWKSKAGDFGMQFSPAVDEEPMSAHRLASQWINSALNLNPYTQLAGQMTAAPMIHRREDRKDDPPVTIALKTARDLFFPRAVPFQPPPRVSAGSGEDLLVSPDGGRGSLLPSP